MFEHVLLLIPMCNSITVAWWHYTKTLTFIFFYKNFAEVHGQQDSPPQMKKHESGRKVFLACFACITCSSWLCVNRLYNLLCSLLQLHLLFCLLLLVSVASDLALGCMYTTCGPITTIWCSAGGTGRGDRSCTDQLLPLVYKLWYLLNWSIHLHVYRK